MERRTLEEVIDTLEKFWICPSSDESNEYCELWSVKDDALGYLKEYQGEFILEERNNLADKFVDAIVESEGNPILAWEELKIGQPIWVEGSIVLAHWLLVQEVREEMIIGIDRYGIRVPLFKDVYGKIWQAYRREKE